MLTAVRKVILTPRDLFRDDFTGDLSHWTKLDTESKISLAGGKLSFAGGKAAPEWGNPSLVEGAIRREAGICLEVDVSSLDDLNSWLGFATGTSPGAPALASTEVCWRWSGGQIRVLAGSADNTNIIDYAASTPYRIRLILGHYDIANKLISPNGFTAYIQGGAFGAVGGPIWTLLARYTTGSTTSLYPHISNLSSVFSYGHARIYRHPFPMPKVYDSFDRADAAVLGNADSGHAWTVGPTGDVWSITTNKAAHTTGHAGTWAYALVDSLLRDIDVSVDYTWVTGAAGGLFFRLNDPGGNESAINGFALRLSSSLTLFRVTTGAPTSIGTYAITPVSGTTYNLKVLAFGSNIRCYLNGALVISATDANYATQTYHGLRAAASVSAGEVWNNFLVQAGLP